MNNVKIGLFLGSTRPGRVSEKVATWVESLLDGKEASFERIDLRDYPLPYVREGENEALVAFKKKIDELDGFVFISPEYNHAIPAVFKNALDSAYVEWKHKSAGIIAYGFAGGARVTEQLRAVLGGFGLADVQPHTLLYLGRSFDEEGNVKPSKTELKNAHATIDDVINWARVLKPLRS